MVKPLPYLSNLSFDDMNSIKRKIGVIHGRFQPLHLDHMKYLLAGFERSDFLFIGITNPDPTKISFNKSDSKRSQNIANPLTYWERTILIQTSLQENGISPNRFCIVPFPINKPEMLKYYVPLDATFFVTIYDAWGRHKRDTLLSLGLAVDVMWERNIEQKGITGTLVRDSIAAGGQWENLVPEAVARIMRDRSLAVRIREMYSKYDTKK